MSEEKLKMPRFCRIIDATIRKIGEKISWINYVLVLNIIVQVFFRYVLNQGQIWLEDLEWHFYGLFIMVSLSYCITEDSHIRMDIIYDKLSPKKKAYVELFGMLVLSIPILIILIYHGYNFVEMAWKLSEKSPHPLGLPYRWIIKSVLPISIFLMLMASISKLIKAFVTIFGRQEHSKG